MIGAVGDLVEDIVVRLGHPIREATDTAASIVRRRGGSAANVAASVARSGHAARFIGQVGDDVSGESLVAALAAEGVDVVSRRGGRTGTIVVLLDDRGERTMLTDRGACTDLDHPDPAWLDELSALHVPLYSLVGEPIASTTATLVDWAHQRDMTVSIDASSTSVIDAIGVGELVELLRGLRPGVLLCNEMEAAKLGEAILPGPPGARVTIVKRGAKPVLVLQPSGERVEVPALSLSDVRDTTGAGDAFAAGFLTALVSGSSTVAAATLGHQSAARAIRSASSRSNR